MSWDKYFAANNCDSVNLLERYLNNILYYGRTIVNRRFPPIFIVSVGWTSKYCVGLSEYWENKSRKQMGFAKFTWKPEKLHYSNLEIEWMKGIQYLGFHISNNFKIKVSVQDRQWKASEMPNFILPLLRTSNIIPPPHDVSVHRLYFWQTDLTSYHGHPLYQIDMLYSR